MDQKQDMPDASASDNESGRKGDLPLDVDALSSAQADRLLAELQRRRQARAVSVEASGEPTSPSAATGPAGRQNGSWGKPFVEALPDLVFRLNRRGEVVNVVSTHSLGARFPRDHFTGRGLSAFVGEASVEPLGNAIRQTLDSGQSRAIHFMLRDGSTCRSVRGRLLQAGPEEVVLILHDAVEPHGEQSGSADKQLRDALCEGGMVVDDRHRVIRYNRRLAQLLDLSEDILADQPDVRVVFRMWAERRGLSERLTERLLADVDRRQPFTMSLEDVADGRVLQMSHHPLPGGGFARTLEDITDQQQLRADLESLNGQMQAVLAVSRDVLYRYDIARQSFDLLSDSAERLLGVSLEDLHGRSWADRLDRVHPEDRPGLTDLPERLARDGTTEPVQREYRLEMSEGNWRWLRERIVPGADEEGRVCTLTGEISDITEIRRAQQDRTRSEQVLQAVLEAAPVPMYYKDASGVYRGCNRAMEEFLGLSGEQIFGQTSFDILSDRQAEVLYHYDQVLLTNPGRQQFETQLHTSDGRRRDILFSRATYCDADHRVAGIVGFLTDLTEQKQTRPLMREDQYRQMFELNRAVKLLVDSETGAIVDANPAAADFYGYKVRDLKQMSISDINILPREQVVEEMIRARSEQRPYFEFRHRLATGEIRDVEVFSGPVQVGDQTLLYSIITDVTERNSANEELRQSQQMYKTLFETMPVGISILDERGLVVDANRESERILGLSAEQQKGRRLENVDGKLLRPDGSRMMPEELPSTRALREHSRVENCPMGTVRPDGKVAWMEVTAAPIPLQGYGVAVAYRDITGRRSAERALSEREEQYRQIFESVNDCLLVYDQDHRIIEANPAACETYGYSRKELLELHARDLIQPEYFHDFENFGRQLKTRGYFYSESVNIRQDGTPFDVDVRGTYFNYLGRPHMLAIVRDITKRKRAEAALRESEERFRRAFEDAAVGVALVGTDGVFIDANAALCSMLGYEKDDLQNLNVLDLTHPEDRHLARDTLPAMLQGRTQRTIDEKRYLHKNGQVVWTQETSSVVLDVYHRPLYLVSQIQNITDRKRAEAALRESEERYRIVSELASDYAYALAVGPNRRLSTEWMTDAFKRITGYEARQLDELGWEHHVHPDDLEEFRRHINAVLNNQHDSAEYRIYTRDGRVIWLADHTQPVWDEARRQVVRLFGTAKDITEQRLAEQALRKARDELELRVQERTRDLTETNRNLQGEIQERERAERALRESEQKFRTLAETVTTGVLILDDTAVSYANRAAERITGYDRDRLYTMDPFAMVHDEFRQEVRDRCRAARQDGEKPWRGEVQIATPHGEQRWIDWSLAPLHYQGRRATLVSLHDVTERKQAEDELRQAHLQLLNAREQERRSLASELHDSFAQDLVVLQLMLQRGMTAPLGAGGNRGEWLGQAGKMCSRLIRDIRHICHGLYPPQLETLGLRQALVSLGEYYEAGDLQVDIRWDCGPEDLRFTPEVEIVLFRIAQEAVSNAMRHGEAKSCSVELRREGDSALMVIEDDGVGFDPGSNKKSGLGLQTMNDRAGAIGGYCEVSSEPGHTVIRAFIPWRLQKNASADDSPRNSGDDAPSA